MAYLICMQCHHPTCKNKPGKNFINTGFCGKHQKNVNFDNSKGQAKIGNTTLTQVHDMSLCEGRGCTIHHPSDHHLRDMRQHWRPDKGAMERTCLHGIGHPDPDDTFYANPIQRVHGCDGCCAVQNCEQAERIVEDDLTPEWLWRETVTDWYMSGNINDPLVYVELNDKRWSEELKREYSEIWRFNS